MHIEVYNWKEERNPLPEGYEICNSIKTNATSFLRTLYTPSINKPKKVKFRLTYKLGETYPNLASLFGCQSSGEWGVIIHYPSNNRFPRIYIGDTVARYFISPNAKVTVNVEIDYTNKIASVWHDEFEDLRIDYPFTTNGWSTAGIVIGANNSSGTVTQYSDIFVYDWEIWENDELYQKFTPCYNPSGTLGNWDSVTNTFFTIGGSGAEGMGRNSFTDFSFSLKNVVDEYFSVIWSERDRQLGDFEITTSIDYKDIFNKNDIICISDSDTAMIIETKEESESLEEGKKLKITGRSIECLLENRIQNVFTSWASSIVRFRALININELLGVTRFKENKMRSLPIQPISKIENLLDYCSDLYYENNMQIKYVETNDSTNYFDTGIILSNNKSFKVELKIDLSALTTAGGIWGAGDKKGGTYYQGAFIFVNVLGTIDFYIDNKASTKIVYSDIKRGIDTVIMEYNAESKIATFSINDRSISISSSGNYLYTGHICRLGMAVLSATTSSPTKSRIYGFKYWEEDPYNPYRLIYDLVPSYDTCSFWSSCLSDRRGRCVIFSTGASIASKFYDYDYSAPGEYLGQTALEILEDYSSKKKYGIRCSKPTRENPIPYLYYSVGLDRTSSQSENERAIFSIKNDTLLSSSHLESYVGYSNVGYVYGTGENPDKSIVEIGAIDTYGINRREAWIDASSESNQDITQAQYEAKLIDEGTKKLNLLEITKALDCEIDKYSLKQYGGIVSLGDKVEIVDSFDNKEEMILSEIVTAYDSTGMKITPTFTKEEEEEEGDDV